MKIFPRMLISSIVMIGISAVMIDLSAKSVKAERNLIKEGNKAFADSNFVEAFALYEKALA